MQSNTSMMDQYGEWVDRRWMGSDPLTIRDHYIMGLGLPGEVGEVCELLKKWQRDGVLDTKKLAKELGDVFYYAVRIATAHGLKPSEVITGNIEKIEDRINRNVLHGSGSDR